jgi:L-fuconolactonase
VEIVDAQVHVPRVVVDWKPGHPRLTDDDAPVWDDPVWNPPRQPPFEAADWDTMLTGTLTAMDAVGVNALVIDEWLGHDKNGRHLPGHEVEGGTWRYTFDFSTYAVERYPERFSFVARADWSDPQVEEVVGRLASVAGMRCLRITASQWPPSSDAFRDGQYGRIFAAALAHDLPVFVWSNGPQLPNVEQYLRGYPGLQFIVDHLGTTSPPPELTGPERYAELETLFELGRRYENLAVKWSTVETQSAETYPYADMFPYLLRALEVFGRERILWASDWSQHRIQHTWAQSLSWILDSNELSSADKEWILGHSTRTVLKWPAVGTDVGSGLYFDCSQAHATMRISGTDEDDFVANMRAHLARWHPQPEFQAPREHLLRRARC